jgi:hypothetical protein
MTASPESTAAEQISNSRVPDFFIVGHAKCGTTALYEMLRQHSQVFMPDHKEPWFFARSNPNPQTSGERSIAFTGKRTETLDEYLSLFNPARADQIVGEASTSYLWSPTAAGAIHEAQPEARIIAVLREPASFLRSLHLQLLVNRNESEKDFRTAISLDEARREDKLIPKNSYWPQSLIYSDRVKYVEQLRRYDKLFPREQMLVIIYDDFRRDNEATVRRVLRFLDVDDSGPIDVMRANPTVGVRSTRLLNLTQAVVAGRGPISGAVKSAIKALTPGQLRREYAYPMRRRMVYAEPRPPDEELTLELRRRFKGEVVALSEYLDRDLVGLWGYDGLD